MDIDYKYLTDIAPLWHDVTMKLEAAQRVRDGLAELIRLVNSGNASTVDARRVLSESKSFAAQVAVLIARYGGCGGCGEHHAVCQAHHIRPRSQGGPTDIDNLMLLCWGCHDKVHHHGWRVVPSGDLHTIAPPERIRHGPARAPDPPPIHGPPHSRGCGGSRRRQSETTPAEAEPLFAMA